MNCLLDRKLNVKYYFPCKINIKYFRLSSAVIVISALRVKEQFTVVEDHFLKYFALLLRENKA